MARRLAALPPPPQLPPAAPARAVGTDAVVIRGVVAATSPRLLTAHRLPPPPARPPPVPPAAAATTIAPSVDDDDDDDMPPPPPPSPSPSASPSPPRSPPPRIVVRPSPHATTVVAALAPGLQGGATFVGPRLVSPAIGGRGYGGDAAITRPVAPSTAPGSTVAPSIDDADAAAAPGGEAAVVVAAAPRGRIPSPAAAIPDSTIAAHLAASPLLSRMPACDPRLWEPSHVAIWLMQSPHLMKHLPRFQRHRIAGRDLLMLFVDDAAGEDDDGASSDGGSEAGNAAERPLADGVPAPRATSGKRHSAMLRARRDELEHVIVVVRCSPQPSHDFATLHRTLPRCTPQELGIATVADRFAIATAFKQAIRSWDAALTEVRAELAATSPPSSHVLGEPAEPRAAVTAAEAVEAGLADGGLRVDNEAAIAQTAPRQAAPVLSATEGPSLEPEVGVPAAAAVPAEAAGAEALPSASPPAAPRLGRDIAAAHGVQVDWRDTLAQLHDAMQRTRAAISAFDAQVAASRRFADRVAAVDAAHTTLVADTIDNVQQMQHRASLGEGAPGAFTASGAEPSRPVGGGGGDGAVPHARRSGASPAPPLLAVVDVTTADGDDAPGRVAATRLSDGSKSSIAAGRATAMELTASGGGAHLPSAARLADISVNGAGHAASTSGGHAIASSGATAASGSLQAVPHDTRRLGDAAGAPAPVALARVPTARPESIGSAASSHVIDPMRGPIAASASQPPAAAAIADSGSVAGSGRHDPAADAGLPRLPVEPPAPLAPADTGIASGMRRGSQPRASASAFPSSTGRRGSGGIILSAIAAAAAAATAPDIAALVEVAMAHQPHGTAAEQLAQPCGSDSDGDDDAPAIVVARIQGRDSLLGGVRHAKLVMMDAADVLGTIASRVFALGLCALSARRGIAARRAMRIWSVGLLLQLAATRHRALVAARVFALGLLPRILRPHLAARRSIKVFAVGALILERRRNVARRIARPSLLLGLIVRPVRLRDQVEAERLRAEAARKEAEERARIEREGPRTKAVYWETITNTAGTIFDVSARPALAASPPAAVAGGDIIDKLGGADTMHSAVSALSSPAATSGPALDVAAMFGDLLETFAAKPRAAPSSKASPAAGTAASPAGAAGGGGLGASPSAAGAAASADVFPPEKSPLDLDPKIAQNVTIALSKLGRPPYTAKATAITQGDIEGLGGFDTLSMLLALPPEVTAPAAVAAVTDWVHRMRNVYEATTLAKGPQPPFNLALLKPSPIERFLVEIVAAVPAWRAKLQVMHFICLFGEMHEAVSGGVDDFLQACEELRGNANLRSFLVDVALPLGNRLNEGTKKGAAVGIRVRSLSQMASTKSASGLTLLEYIASKLCERQPPATELLSLPKQFPHLKEAARAPQLPAILAEITKLRSMLTTTEGQVKAAAGVADRRGSTGAEAAAAAAAAAPAPPSVFAERMVPHMQQARVAMEELDAKAAAASAAYESTCRYFGEDSRSLQSDEFFAMWLDWLQMYAKAVQKATVDAEKKAKAEAREREKAAKEAAAASAAGKSPAGGAASARAAGVLTSARSPVGATTAAGKPAAGKPAAGTAANGVAADGGPSGSPSPSAGDLARSLMARIGARSPAQPTASPTLARASSSGSVVGSPRGSGPSVPAAAATARPQLLAPDATSTPPSSGRNDDDGAGSPPLPSSDHPSRHVPGHGRHVSQRFAAAAGVITAAAALAAGASAATSSHTSSGSTDSFGALMAAAGGGGGRASRGVHATAASAAGSAFETDPVDSGDDGGDGGDRYAAETDALPFTRGSTAAARRASRVGVAILPGLPLMGARASSSGAGGGSGADAIGLVGGGDDEEAGDEEDALVGAALGLGAFGGAARGSRGGRGTGTSEMAGAGAGGAAHGRRASHWERFHRASMQLDSVASLAALAGGDGDAEG